MFCKLAVARGVVPLDWKRKEWGASLKVAGGLLLFAFEKNNATEKWGGEDIFSAVMGGRPLRYTAEVVYSSSCMSYDQSEEHDEMDERVRGWG